MSDASSGAQNVLEHAAPELLLVDMGGVAAITAAAARRNGAWSSTTSTPAAAVTR